MISADEHAPHSPYSRDAAPEAVTPLNMVKKKKKQQKQAGSAVRLPHHVPALSLMLPKEKWLAAPPPMGADGQKLAEVADNAAQQGIVMNKRSEELVQLRNARLLEKVCLCGSNFHSHGSHPPSGEPKSAQMTHT
jgi:hypothetical protein